MRYHEYFVYILSNRSRNTYVGVTNDLVARMREHRASRPGTYTARLRIHRLVYFERLVYINNAIAREKYIKHMTRAEKDALVNKDNPTWADIAADAFADYPRQEQKRKADPPTPSKDDKSGADPPPASKDYKSGADPPPAAKDDKSGADSPTPSKDDKSGADPPTLAKNDKSGADPPTLAKDDKSGADPPPAAKDDKSGKKDDESPSKDDKSIK